MTIYDALSKDHRKVDAILDRLIATAQTGGPAWSQCLEELRAELIPHAHAEEAVFYNALREADESKSLVMHSYSEHLMAETELRTLGAMETFGQSSVALAEKLAKDLRHHVKEEEGKVFTAARKVFSDEEAQQIGAAFERLKPEMQVDAESMAASTMDLIANMLPKRLVDVFHRSVHGRKKSAA